MMNVKFGRWKMVCEPAQDIALGKYGLTPGPIDANVLAQVEKQTGKKRVTERPADLLAPGMEKYRKQCADKGLPTTDEIVVLFAMFPQQVEELLRPKTVPAVPVVSAAPPAPAKPASTTVRANGPGRHLFVTVNGTRHDVTVQTLEG
jgi:pyruvate/oxaloacetate carboxyltransferase